MNAPVKKGSEVHRSAGVHTPTIHRLLTHVRARGVDWVPRPLSCDRTTEVLTYLDGDVPHDMPSWIWDGTVLRTVARRLRCWHDATADFPREGALWGFSTGQADEVICHNDFAPYNCVFQNGTFSGLIDFDLCAPGSRLWDMTYCAYRFVPLMSDAPLAVGQEFAPFPLGTVLERLEIFLDEYSRGDPPFRYGAGTLLQKTAERLDRIAVWTADFAARSGNTVLAGNAIMYRDHAGWIRSLGG